MKKFILISEEKLAEITSEPIQQRVSEKSFILEAFEIDELFDSNKTFAIQENRRILITDNWYEDIYEEAEEIGVKITGFIVNFFKIEAVFQYNFLDTCNLVFKKYMPESQIYKDCLEALAVYSELETEPEKDKSFEELKQYITNFYMLSLNNKSFALQKYDNVVSELKRQHILFNADGTKFLANE